MASTTEADTPGYCARRAHARAMSVAWGATGELATADAAVFAARESLEAIWSATGVPVDAQARLNAATLDELDLGPDAPGPTEPELLDPDRLFFRVAAASVHPMLPPSMRVLTLLRVVAGSRTGELCRIFNVDEATMLRRLDLAFERADRYRDESDELSPESLAARVSSGLSTVQLVFDEGYVGMGALDRGPDNLCALATFIVREALAVLPDEPEVRAMLATMLLQDSRRQARIRDDGTLEPLWHQDRSLWDANMINEGRFLLRRARQGGESSRYELLARIQQEYVTAPSYAQIDWPMLVSLHHRVLARWPDPIVAVGLVTALNEAEGPASALTTLEQLELKGATADSTRAMLLQQLGRAEESARTADQATASATPAWHLADHW